MARKLQLIGDGEDGDVPRSLDAAKPDAIVDGAAGSDHSGVHGLPRLLRYALLAKEDVDDTPRTA